MNQHDRLMLAAVAVALLAWVGMGKPGMPELDGLREDDSRPAVSEDLQQTVRPVAKLFAKADKSDRAKAAKLFAAFADDVTWKDSPLKTLGDVRGLQSTAWPLYLKGEKIGAEGTADAIDGVLTGELGEDDVALDDATRKKAAAVFRALSAAAGG